MSRAALTILTLVVVMTACREPTAFEADAGTPTPGVLQLLDYDGPRVVSGNDTRVQWSVAPGDDVLAPVPVIAAPDTVDADVPFDVVVTTIGPSGCWRTAAQDVRQRVASRVVALSPLDVHSGADVCTGVVLYLSHPASVTIDEPGAWTLEVVGRRIRHGSLWEEPVTAQKSIVVR